MPDIYLRHPLHGEKVEHNESLAQMDKGNGWVEFDPAVKPEPEVVPPVVNPSMVVPDFLKAAPKAPKSPKG